VSSAPNGLAVALVDALDAAAIDVLLDRASEATLARLASRLKPHLAGMESDRWLTTAEAAAHLGCSPNALHKLTAARALPFQQDCPGGKLYFNRSQLDAWREGRQQDSGTSRGACASKMLPKRGFVA
jgi:excisionase family DNA binding protein